MGADKWSNSTNRWASLDTMYLLNVGWWRKKGGKVKFVNKKVGSRN
jgi:hypothetical protein